MQQWLSECPTAVFSRQLLCVQHSHQTDNFQLRNQTASHADSHCCTPLDACTALKIAVTYFGYHCPHEEGKQTYLPLAKLSAVETQERQKEPPNALKLHQPCNHHSFIHWQPGMGPQIHEITPAAECCGGRGGQRPSAGRCAHGDASPGGWVAHLAHPEVPS